MSELSNLVKITYKNYRGETAVRTISPIEIRFGATQWHTTPQWFLRAWDHDKKATRNFSMQDISAWIEVI